MRKTSPRFAELLTVPNKWETKIEWSNDGFATSNFASIHDQGGNTVTCSAKSQVRWTCDLGLVDQRKGLDQWNMINTTFRIWHGIEGEPLLPMGKYKATYVRGDSGSPILNVRGESFERYLIMARFPTDTLIPASGAFYRLQDLIRPVIGSSYVHVFKVDDEQLPAFQSGRDRWAVIDGQQTDTTSISRALAARTYTGPYGEFITAPVPSLEDPIAWTARSGDVKISDSEEFDDELLRNFIVVTGINAEGATVVQRFVFDDDPLSPTYYNRTADQGGIYRWVLFYTSPLITKATQADATGRSMLAERLGFRQQIEFSQLHDPRIEVGDVGLVGTDDGDRLALIDDITYDLLGGPLRTTCRTTISRYMGTAYDVFDEETRGDPGSVE